MKAKTTFEKVTTDALDILSSNAPAIGLNKSEFQNKVIFCRFWSLCSNAIYIRDDKVVKQSEVPKETTNHDINITNTLKKYE